MTLGFKHKIPDTVAYLLLLCPSFVLYSSLSLRETIITFLSVLTLIFIIQKKKVLSVICLFLCLLVKIQNAVGLAVGWGFSSIFKSYKHQLNLIIPFIMMIVTLIILSPNIIPVFNFWRAAFLLENDMSVDLVMSLTQDVSIRSFLIYLFKAMLVYPFSPFPWQTNGFGLIMFFESVFLFGVYSALFIKHFKFKIQHSLMFKTLCLGALIAAGVSAYVGVFANQGTMARYRFTGLFPYLVASFYIYYKDKQVQELV